ncbi:hypothetical protein [Glycomyces sambucus]|nr:hypothetical protein [Glycomyces sambucus]
MSLRDRNLLKEIEAGALNESRPLTPVLQQCIVLGGKAGSAELRDWARAELTGSFAELPSYRKVAGDLKIDGVNFHNRITGQSISSFALPDFAQKAVTNEVQIGHGIASIEALIRSTHRSGKSTVQLAPPGSSELVSVMNQENASDFQQITRLYWDVHVAVLEGIVSQIRTMLIGLVAEMKALTEDRQDLPSPEAASDAVRIVIQGGERNQVVVNAQAIGSSESVSMQSNAPGESGKNRSRLIWTIVGSLAGIASVLMAYLQFKG